MFDKELKKHDLNPLIKMSGGYLVDDSDPDTSLFINVCRDISECLDVLWGSDYELITRLHHFCLYSSFWRSTIPVRPSKKAFILMDDLCALLPQEILILCL